MDYKGAMTKFPGFARLVFLSLLVAATAHAELKVGLVLDKGGKDDKSFNAAAYQGAMKAKGELKIFVKTVEATDDNAFEPHASRVRAAGLRPDHRHRLRAGSRR